MRALLWRAWPLVALRLLGLAVAQLPALWLVRGALSGSIGKVPSVAEGPPPVALVDLVGTARNLPPAAAVAAAAGLIAFYLYDQTLTATALLHLAPHGTAAPGLWRTWRRFGLGLLPEYLRVGAGCGLLGLAGLVAAAAAFDALDAVATRAAWDGMRRVVEIPGALLFATTLWWSTVGALGFWSRVLIAAGGRRRVRRAFGYAAAVLRRAPLRAWAVYVGVAMGLQLLGGALLVRQAPDGGGALRLGTFGLYLLLQCCSWLGLLAAAHGLLADPALAAVRAGPDEPYRLEVWLRGLLRRRPPAAGR